MQVPRSVRGRAAKCAAPGGVALLGRFYESFCDHAVEIGDRVVFLETGLTSHAGERHEGEPPQHGLDS